MRQMVCVTVFGSYSLRSTHPCVGRQKPCRSPNRYKRRVHSVGRQEPCRVQGMWVRSPNRGKRRVHRVGRQEPCRVHRVWAMSPNRPKRRVHRVGRQESKSSQKKDAQGCRPGESTACTLSCGPCRAPGVPPCAPFFCHGSFHKIDKYSEFP